MTSSATRVARVRLHGDGLDATQARLRLGSLLAGAELRPSGLPPSALLCVRRIDDPLPGVLQLDTGATRVPLEWERAFIAVLDHALRGAARPAREAVPAGAEAVVFADRAELLACLARDARDGTAWASWWWHDVRAAAGGAGDPVVAAWLETPEHVPAAFELLAARGDATQFAAGLAPVAAAAIAERVAAAFALTRLRRIAATATRPGETAGADAARAAPPPEPPWRRLVPETGQQPLAPAAELLLGIALSLRRSPVVVRAPAFAKATRAWLVAEHAERTPAPPVPRHSPGPFATSETAQQAERSEIATRAEAASVGVETAPAPPTVMPPSADPPERHVAGAESAPSQSEPPLPEDDATAAASSSASHQRATDGAEHAVAPPQRDTAAPAEVALPEPPAVHAAVPRQDTPQRPSEPAPSTAVEPKALPLVHDAADELPAQVVDTELGGVFYLLNLALFLELYGDFSRPLEPGLALSPWDLLALLAPTLLTDPTRDDPLWRLLARLAGRAPREKPGGGFRPSASWRTPASWLEPFDHDGTWHWSAAGGTLRLRHPAGFTAVAVPRRDEPAQAQLARELRRLRPLAPAVRRTSLRREPAQPLARWTSRLSGYTDARLRRALGLAPTDTFDVLLRRRARVFVTPTHVDIVLRLADLPLEVRFAGLDRTPGWIPAAGYYVALHFE